MYWKSEIKIQTFTWQSGKMIKIKRNLNCLFSDNTYLLVKEKIIDLKILERVKTKN